VSPIISYTRFRVRGSKYARVTLTNILIRPRRYTPPYTSLIGYSRADNLAVETFSLSTNNYDTQGVGGSRDRFTVLNRAPCTSVRTVLFGRALPKIAEHSPCTPIRSRTDDRFAYRANFFKNISYTVSPTRPSFDFLRLFDVFQPIVVAPFFICRFSVYGPISRSSSQPLLNHSKPTAFFPPTSPTRFPCCT